MITTKRMFFRKKMGEELAQDKRAKRTLKKSPKFKPTYHNQFCLTMGLLKEMR